MKKALDFLMAKPARFFLLAAMIWGGIMCYLNSKDVGDNGFSWHDLLVEANGMVFDLLVFGILLSVYEGFKEKKERVERLKEEIDDYRGWNNEEGERRICGAIKRLNELDVSEIDLSSCFLERASLRGVNLRNANLQVAKLQGSNLKEANLQGADLSNSELMWAFLQKTDFRGAKLKGVDLRGAQLQEAQLENQDLRDVTFGIVLVEQNPPKREYGEIQDIRYKTPLLFVTNLHGAKLEGAFIGLEGFEKLEELEVLGIEEIKGKYFIDNNGRFQFKIN